MKYGLVLFLALAMGGCATTTREAQIQTVLSLSKEHFKNTATVKDDSLDTVATITTVNGFQEKRGLLGIVWDDNFLRAFVDKKTGKTSFQLYQVIYYQGSGWNFFHTVNFETPSGPQSKPVTVISRDVDCTGSRYGGCTYVEHLAFDVDQSLLRIIAANYSLGQRAGWKFKFTAKSGQEYNDGMLPAEIAGLLEKVDEYRNAKGFGAHAFDAVTQADDSTPTLSPTLSQKEKWVTTMAVMNGCVGTIKVNSKNKSGIREVFVARCENKMLEFTCEFSGPVTEGMGGIPFVVVTGKSYQTQPACWH